jgi:hypothetical protein
VKKLISVLVVLLAILACTDENATRETLRKSGYTKIQTTGYSFFECGEGDTFHTGFTATNPAGERVSGTVCCGILKGCTVRF